MARYELIVFDWDGTLVDSAGAIVAAFQSAARDLGLAPPDEDSVRYIIGLGLQDALRQVMPELAPARYAEMAERYRHHYFAHDLGLVLFAGAERLVHDLKSCGYLLGVATGKSRSGLNLALDAFGLGRVFDGTRCADECVSKPHPEMLEELMEELDVARESTLMIGDTTHDLQMAGNAGVAAVAISHGAHDKQSLLAQAPLHCADDIDELATWLRTNG